MNGGEYMVVFSRELEDCAVLRQDEKGQWSCTSCERNKMACVHMKAADGTPRQPRTTTEELRARLDKFLDPEGKARRLTCVSQLPVPQAVYASEYASRYISAMLPISRKDLLSPCWQAAPLQPLAVQLTRQSV